MKVRQIEVLKGNKKTTQIKLDLHGDQEAQQKTNLFSRFKSQLKRIQPSTQQSKKIRRSIFEEFYEMK